MADFLLITVPSQKHQIRSNHGISSFRSKRRNANIGPNTGLEVSHHKRNEFNKLSEEEENKVRQLSPNKRIKVNDYTHASKIAALESKLAKKIQVITSLKAKPFPDSHQNL